MSLTEAAPINHVGMKQRNLFKKAVETRIRAAQHEEEPLRPVVRVDTDMPSELTDYGILGRALLKVEVDLDEGLQAGLRQNVRLSAYQDLGDGNMHVLSNPVDLNLASGEFMAVDEAHGDPNFFVYQSLIQATSRLT